MSGNRVVWLSPNDPPDAFPDIRLALREPDGLLAAGGDLGSERLLAAYVRGIFPWFDENQPILWWSPDPRCIIEPRKFHVSRRLKRSIRRTDAEISVNRAFSDVILACSAPRRSQAGTWITPEIVTAYERLHAEGWAHSIEVRMAGALVGGIYGLSIGRVFFGESMFSRADNASKFALLALSQWLSARNFALIDCQVASPHLFTLGAELMSRERFRGVLERACRPATKLSDWPRTPLPVSALCGEAALQ